MAHSIEFLLHERVAQHAARQPDACAVICDGVRLTYAEVAHRAHRLATRLADAGVRPETRVAIYLPRSVDVVVAMLGVLEAGGAYVALEPAHPRPLLEYMLDDADVVALVTKDGLRGTAPERRGMHVLPVDAPEATSSIALPAVDPGQVAYVIYTSGSTGRPKGVAVTHRSLAYSTSARFEIYPGPAPCCLVLPSMAFDSGAAGVFWPLAAGGTVVMPGVESARDPEQMAELIGEHRVSHVLGLWSTYNDILAVASDGQLETLRVAIVGGEACPPALVERHERRLPHARLSNEYGPSEATVWSTWHECTADDAARVPIGRAIPGAQAYLLDRQLRPVADGAQGEIYLAGPGVARGYWGKPALTAGRFLPDPFSGREGERMYWTRDIARRSSNGELEYIGRSDHQVKVRGFRVEPGEVEAAICASPDVTECAVVSEEHERERQLVAYVAFRDPETFASARTAALREHLRAQLPEYMVPAEIVALERLPRTLSGKVDRGALRATAKPQPALQPAAAPLTPLEEALAAIWCEVLETDHIDVQENFFDVGGHSMRLVRVASLIKQRLGSNLQLVTLLTYPTIRSLAAHLAEHEAAKTPVTVG